MKEYLYISDRKLESYEAQIPAGLAKSLSSEISANIGVLSAKLKTRDPRTDRVTRVQLVSDFICSHFRVGSLVDHQPSHEWVLDSLRVRHVQILEAPDVFFLVGVSKSNEVCALIGSTNHVLGGGSAEFAKYSASYFPHFVRNIVEAQDQAASRILSADLSGAPRKLILGNSDEEIAGILNGFQSQASGYEFQVEFLARSLFRGQTSGLPFTNALTPLWVSLD